MIELRTILMADDNLKDVELTLEAMADNNLANQVIVVKDGVEALEYLRREGKFKDYKEGNPCVILLDIKMPRMDGIEVLRHIRSDKKLKRIPVIVLSSSREEKDLCDAYDLGVSGYVVKPVNFQKFIDAIKQIGSFWAVLNELPPDNRTNDGRTTGNK